MSSFFQKILVSNGLLIFVIALIAAVGTRADEDSRIRVLLLDGRNNHDWEVTSDALRAILEATDRFSVEAATAPERKTASGPRAPRSDDEKIQQQFADFREAYDQKNKATRDAFQNSWKSWAPDFAKYDVVLVNYNGDQWPEAMKLQFADYLRAGGGAVFIHAANNAFRDWDEFNKIIGMGWRPAPFGKAIKIRETDGTAYWDKEAGNSGHGSRHAFQIAVRQAEHPIMRGLPSLWMHGKDELYHDMRGPAENLTILSSAFSDPKQNGTGKHEPITWEVAYGKGRVIVTTMGHFWRGQTDWDGLHCVGFQTIVARSCEYGATGQVTLPIPEKFPKAEEVTFLSPSLAWSSGQDGASESEAAEKAAQEKKKTDPYVALSPAEEKTTFELAPGYVAELVASEPQVQEPVLTVWDGNGAMYVAEMRSYMQDENGTGTKDSMNGRVKRLLDTDGDGRMDEVTVFIDKLNLPRMILPLDDRILVRETDTMDVISYRDTDGDGVADEKELIYERGSYGRGNTGSSVEHQDSGLLWNLDNHIYLSYNIERYRFTDQSWEPEKQRGHWTQWGLANNDFGDLFWITNTDPMAEPYLPPRYWETANRLAGRGINGKPIDLGQPFSPDFLQADSSCLLNDRGGEAAAVRAFTSACGQTVFRGHKLPFADRGRYFFCDPTIHVVRRANLEKKDGLDFLSKVEASGSEFFRSSDINCRFVNTATGPDGALYVTDMYRGIIQDAPWLNPDSRAFIKEVGLSENKQMGRIWRIRHADHQPASVPRMLEETTVQLLRHLESPNGWNRDTAQKLIILRNDRDDVAELLLGMARFSDKALTRLHALWTLEGIGKLNPELVKERFTDRDPMVRRAAIQIYERYLTQQGTVSDLTGLSGDRSAAVVAQLILSLGTIPEENEEALDLIQKAARGHMGDQFVMLATGVSLWGKKELPLIGEVESGDAFAKLPEAERGTHQLNWKNVLANWERGLDFPESMSRDDQRWISDGERIYFRSCISCHGAGGEGVNIPGTDLSLAPSLRDSARVSGDAEELIPVMLHGLMGPINGENYQAGFMAPASALGIVRSDNVGRVLSYIRYAWDGEQEEIISREQVDDLKTKLKDRSTPWTDDELKNLSLPE